MVALRVAARKWGGGGSPPPALGNPVELETGPGWRDAKSDVDASVAVFGGVWRGDSAGIMLRTGVIIGSGLEGAGKEGRRG